MKVFTTHPSRWDLGSFRLLRYPPDADWDHEEDGEPPLGEVVASGSSLLALWNDFARWLAGTSGSSLGEAAARILSGDDTGDDWTCHDETLRSFLASLAGPGLVVSAHYCLGSCEVLFRRPNKVIHGCYPDSEFLFAVNVVQLDDIYWAMKGDG